VSELASREQFTLRPEQVTVPAGHVLTRLPAIGVGVAVLALLVSIVLASAGDRRQFLFSWLVAYVFFLSLALGAAYFVLIQYVTQAGWSVVLRRTAENVMGTLPLFAVLFIPILLGLSDLYAWTAPGDDPLLRAQAPYLNVPFFLVRAAIYIGVWSTLGLVWSRASRRQDTSGDPAISARLRRWSGPALMALAVTQTFAAIDWVLSLQPHWYSTIFGVYFFAGSLVSFLALLALAAAGWSGTALLGSVVTREHLHDTGKLLFGFTCFWAYIAFSQFFLIWYANLPEETVWFRARLEGTWHGVSVLLAVGHFLIPFFFFMPRAVKRNGRALAVGAAWMLVMHYIDIYWQVMPPLHPAGPQPSLMDLTALLAVGGSVVAAAGMAVRRSALVPLKDPRLPESLSFENV
jgi:hypothetical protein